MFMNLSKLMESVIVKRIMPCTNNESKWLYFMRVMYIIEFLPVKTTDWLTINGGGLPLVQVMVKFLIIPLASCVVKLSHWNVIVVAVVLILLKFRGAILGAVYQPSSY